MYIMKNALRSISRAKGRNVLIGIIVFIIATAACVSLSIREAANNVRTNNMESLEITAQISMDRQQMMQGMGDRESMKDAMTKMEDLSLEEMQTYAEAESVKDFYYTATTS